MNQRWILALLPFLLIGCSTEEPRHVVVSNDSMSPEQEGALLALGYVAESDMEPNASPKIEQRLIRRGEITFQTDDVGATLELVRNTAEEHAGQLADARFWTVGDGNRQATATLRVPEYSFDDVMTRLRAVAEVTHESISAEDVTKAYLDLETRLSVQRQTEARLRDLLNERTGKLSEVLLVEKELSRVIESIERLEGQRRYYDSRINYATIDITFMQTIEEEEEPPMFAAIGDAFNAGLGTLSHSVAMVIYLVVFLAPWLALTVAFWFLYRTFKRRRPSAAQ